MRHHLQRHGLLLFFAGLITGFAVPAMTNPRAGLAGHVEALMNGMFLLIVGLAWPELRFSERAGRAVGWLLVFGAYANWAATTASGVLGTSTGTPIAGAGFEASPLAERAVFATLVVVGLTMTVACGALVGAAWRSRGASVERGARSSEPTS